MTRLRQESDHLTLSSSSSTSPTTTVSRDSETREREDLSGKDSIQCLVSSPHVEMKNEATRCILTQRSDCKNSEKISWMTEFLKAETHTSVFLMNHLWSLHLREVWIWVKTVSILTSLMTKIARSVRGPKLQEPRAEDVMAELYFVQKILVT